MDCDHYCYKVIIIHFSEAAWSDQWKKWEDERRDDG